VACTPAAAYITAQQGIQQHPSKQTPINNRGSP